MADAYRGGDQALEIGPAADSRTVISGEGNGLSEFQLDRTRAARVIPGGGQNVRRQKGALKDATFTFSVDANSITWPLLFGKTGERLYFEWSPRGTASGMPALAGSGFVQITEPFPSDDVVRFSVSGEVDGAITETVH